MPVPNRLREPNAKCSTRAKKPQRKRRSRRSGFAAVIAVALTAGADRTAWHQMVIVTQIYLLALAAGAALLVLAFAVLLCRASLRVTGRGFDRVIYLLRLMTMDVPCVISRRTAPAVTARALAAATAPPPPVPPRAFACCPECALHHGPRAVRRPCAATAGRPAESTSTPRPDRTGRP